MRQSRDAWAGNIRFWAAVSLLVIPGLASRAEQPEPLGNDPSEEPALSLAEQADALLFTQAPPPPWSGNIWTRSQLTGDWAARVMHWPNMA